jgi:hypothetical protein
MGYVRVRPTIKYEPPKRDRYEVDHVLDIFVGYLAHDEFAAHFRIFSDQFYYDYLGDRMQSSSVANFRLLLTDILYYADDPALTDNTRAFLAGRAPDRPFDGFQAFDEYNNWSVAISRARAAGEID